MGLRAHGCNFSCGYRGSYLRSSAFIGDSKDFGWHHSQLTQSADELGLGGEHAVDGAGGEELGDAAAAAALLHLDAQLVAGDHGALEARAVDADEVVDPLA